MTPTTGSAGGPRVVLRRAVLFFLALAAVLPPGPAAAQTCDRSGCGLIACGTPARPVPQSYWGELQPADPNPLPLLRDATAFDQFGPPPQNLYSLANWYMGVDPQNGYLFTAMGYGLDVWDLRTHPDNPELLGKLSYTSFPVWVDDGEEKLPLQDVAAPPGVDSIAALAGRVGIGLAIVDLTQKTAPRILYQSDKKNGEEVYAATLGGQPYAFLAASGGTPGGGVFAYDMNQARQYFGCSDRSPLPATPAVARVSTWARSGIGPRSPSSMGWTTSSSFPPAPWAAWRSGTWPTRGTPGSCSRPSMSPRFARTTCGPSMASRCGRAQPAVTTLGLRKEKYSCAQQRAVNEAQIYDVTCNLAGTCNSLGNPIFSQELNTGTPTYFVTFSTSNGTPYLYYGSDDKCRGGSQREWLFDVSNPASPRDITPRTGYWGWYYRGGSTGFNGVMPRRAKFYNEYLYRAGLSILDIHRHTVGVPPTAGFTWPPGEIYPGNPVFFQDTSSASPSTWTWTFNDAPAAPSVRGREGRGTIAVE
jgi:hypothetical protein